MKDKNFPKFPKMHKLSKNIALERIDIICRYQNYKFLGFCDKEGNDYEWNGVDNTYLKLHCNKCGHEWHMVYHNFAFGKGCPKCAIINNHANNILKEEKALVNILQRCSERNYTFMGYKENKWIGTATHLKLHCNKCGYEWSSGTYNQLVNQNKCYCKYCEVTKSLMIEEKALNEIHKKCLEKNYSFLYFCTKNGNKCEWKGSHKTYLMLHCNKCNNMWSTCTYHNFINHDKGCPKCKGGIKYTYEDIVELLEENKKEGITYDNNTITDYLTDMKFICEKHGEYWQSPKVFLKSCGCPHCVSSRLENEIRNLLKRNNIKFKVQKTFPWLKSDANSYQKLDFYLIDYNLAIECQGIQHFEKTHWGGIEGFERRNFLDKNKYNLCKEHGIQLLYYSNLGIDYPYEVFEDKDKLLEEITKKSRTI